MTIQHDSSAGTEVVTSQQVSDAPQDKEGTTGVVQRIFKFTTDSFGPLIPLFAGSATIKALLAILLKFHAIDPKGGTYLILAAAGNAIFYFLPIFLGFTAAKALNANTFIGAAIGASLLEPNFTSLLLHGSRTSFIGIPVILANYSSTILPIFFAIPLFALVERQLNRFVPKDLKLFLVPMISLMIFVPLAAIVVGPFGTYAGKLVSDVISALFRANGLIAGGVLGAAWTFLTIVGLHIALIPIVIVDLAKGGDPLLATASAGVFAQIGFALGMLVRARNSELRSLAGASIVPGVLSGETRPILYGLFLPFYKRTFLYVALSGAAGGAIAGAAGVKMVSLAFPSFLSIPLFAPMVPYIIGMAVALVGTFALTLIFGYEKSPKKAI
ncbi:MAG: PTS transporter subunit EIIC [Actinomycetota bacterium]|nr:PTS transporter subunit EIIC [Actinomycetota bacterium]